MTKTRKGGDEVALKPLDTGAMDIASPEFASLGLVEKMAHEPPHPAAKIEYSLASEGKARIKDTRNPLPPWRRSMPTQEVPRVRIEGARDALLGPDPYLQELFADLTPDPAGQIVGRQGDLVTLVPTQALFRQSLVVYHEALVLKQHVCVSQKQR